MQHPGRKSWVLLLLGRANKLFGDPATKSPLRQSNKIQTEGDSQAKLHNFMSGATRQTDTRCCQDDRQQFHHHTNLTPVAAISAGRPTIDR